MSGSVEMPTIEAMLMIRRVGSLLAFALGLVGVAACMAGIFGVWLLKSRLDQANEKLGAALDKGLVSIQDRVRGALKRVQDSKITTSELGQRLRDWSSEKAKERLVSRLDIESRAEKLTGQMQRADAMLAGSTELLEGAREVLALGSSLGAPVDPASLEGILEKLQDARNKMQQAEQWVDKVREFASVKEDDSGDSRLGRVVKLAARTLVTIGEVDSRLEETLTRLAELQTKARQWNTRMSNYILLTAIAAGLLLTWIGAGQAALCLLARRT